MAAKVEHSIVVEKSSNQNSASPAPTPRATSTSKVTLRSVKAGINFVIPKNKLSGALVRVNRGGAKLEADDLKKDDETKQPQRKTKWGFDLSQDTVVRKGRALAYQTRVEQITTQLETGVLEEDFNEDTRSPSPPAEYDASNQRVSTREARVKEQLDLERREAIGECMLLNPAYKPPPGYKPVFKEDKFYIPVKEYPSFNFVGLISGPEGKTRKRLEEETGTKIAIRGVVKDAEGKVQSVELTDNDVEAIKDDLHVHISADTYAKVDAAIAFLEMLMTSVEGNIPPAKANAVSSGDITIPEQATTQVPTNYNLPQVQVPTTGELIQQTWPTPAPSLDHSGSNFQLHHQPQWQPPVMNSNAGSVPSTMGSVTMPFPAFQQFPFGRGRPPLPGFNPQGIPPNLRNPMGAHVNRPQPTFPQQQRPPMMHNQQPVMTSAPVPPQQPVMGSQPMPMHNLQQRPGAVPPTQNLPLRSGPPAFIPGPASLPQPATAPPRPSHPVPPVSTHQPNLQTSNPHVVNPPRPPIMNLNPGHSVGSQGNQVAGPAIPSSLNQAAPTAIRPQPPALAMAAPALPPSGSHPTFGAMPSSSAASTGQSSQSLPQPVVSAVNSGIAPAPPSSRFVPPLSGQSPNPAMGGPIPSNVFNSQAARMPFASQRPLQPSHVPAPVTVIPAASAAITVGPNTNTVPLQSVPSLTMQPTSMPMAIRPPSQPATHNTQVQGTTIAGPNANTRLLQPLSSGDFTFQPQKSQPPQANMAQPLQALPNQSRPGIHQVATNTPQSQIRPNTAAPPPFMISGSAAAPPLPPLPPQAPSFRPAGPSPSQPPVMSVQLNFTIPSQAVPSQGPAGLPPRPQPFSGPSQPVPPRLPQNPSVTHTQSFGPGTAHPAPAPRMPSRPQLASETFFPSLPSNPKFPAHQVASPFQRAVRPGMSGVSNMAPLASNVHKNQMPIASHVLPSNQVRPLNAPQNKPPRGDDFAYQGHQMPVAKTQNMGSQSYDPFSPTSIASEQAQRNQNSKPDDKSSQQHADADYENLMESVGVR